MATYVLIPGAGGAAWTWHRLAAELHARGQEAIAVDLPADDDAAGLDEYVAAVVRAVGDRTDLIVVAHSFGGFTAPLVCERLPVRLLVLLSAMIPVPGEPPAQWWDNTGYEQARREQADRGGVAADADLAATFFHDVPPEVVAEAAHHHRDQSMTPAEKPWPLPARPEVPTRFLLCRDDRFFPADFMRRVVRERLGMVPDEMAGGHLVMLSRPAELADRLEAYRLATQSTADR
ncbi:alpha/beta hydrolase [Micromonospora sp. CPCC 206060]|uniref:alpha/beta fold hydrolase n=1 Tax=Micromonospora sp. CPCC 206060 TaxID=3122406 RepID=UPI002FF299E8